MVNLAVSSIKAMNARELRATCKDLGFPVDDTMSIKAVKQLLLLNAIQ